MTRQQFWRVVHWTLIQNGETPEGQREAREALEASGSALQDLLADGQTQAAFDLLRSLGILDNPARPSVVSVENTDYQTVEVTSSDVGADEYVLWRAAAADADDLSAFEEISRSGTVVLTDATGVPGVQYAYRVSGVTSGSTSLPSTSVLHTWDAVPQVEGLAATDVAAPVLTWTDLVPAPDEYVVYRDGAEIARPATDTHTDSTAAADTTYTYTVSAVYAGVEGPESAGADATTPAGP